MNHSTITAEQESAIAAMLSKMPNLPSGIGTEESACSIAAINLALTGRLTDEIPGCMSLVIGKWIIKVQDLAPADMRNSERWRRLLPLAAGTGRGLDLERSSVALDWMWSVVLVQLQPLAEKRGFGESWLKMCELRTPAAAYDCASACRFAAAGCVAATASAAASDYAASASDSVSAFAAATAAAADFWHSVDPCGCLERMISLSEGDRNEHRTANH